MHCCLSYPILLLHHNLIMISYCLPAFSPRTSNCDSTSARNHSVAHASFLLVVHVLSTHSFCLGNPSQHSSFSMVDTNCSLFKINRRRKHWWFSQSVVWTCKARCLIGRAMIALCEWIMSLDFSSRSSRVIPIFVVLGVPHSEQLSSSIELFSVMILSVYQ